VQPREVSTLFVGTGPGSYPGLRVAIATALGWARGAGAGVVGIPSVDALLYAELRVGEQGVWFADARGGRVYATCQRRLEDRLECRIPLCLVEHAELAALVQDGDRVLGDAAVAQRAALSLALMQRLETDLVPRASSLLRLGQARVESGEAQAVESLEPLYLRAFEAVRRRR
jgi:N6-L-threonylcarbamoyladenine synthase